MMQKNKYSDIYKAARNSVVFQIEDNLHCLIIEGPDASEVLDVICPCDVFLQDGQIKQTLLLSNEGLPFADIYIGREAECYFMLGYWSDTDALIEWINSFVSEKLNFEIADLDLGYKTVTIEGPFSWELTAQIINSDILGLPYLGVMKFDNKYIFRAGITGEYGYHILVENKEFESFRNKLLLNGNKFGLLETNEEVKSQCVLESFFFNMNQEGAYNLNPMELQLQWRISRQKSNYPGAEAIMKIKENGWDKRLTCFSSTEEVHKDEIILSDGEEVGTVLNVGYSPLRKDYVGKALIKKPYWHSGISYYRVGQIAIKTISAPAVLFKSLGISPYKDSYFSSKKDGNEI